MKGVMIWALSRQPARRSFSPMPLKANDYHNHLKLKIKAQICYFLPFEALFFTKTRDMTTNYKIGAPIFILKSLCHFNKKM